MVVARLVAPQGQPALPWSQTWPDGHTLYPVNQLPPDPFGANCCYMKQCMDADPEVDLYTLAHKKHSYSIKLYILAFLMYIIIKVIGCLVRCFGIVNSFQNIKPTNGAQLQLELVGLHILCKHMHGPAVVQPHRSAKRCCRHFFLKCLCEYQR